MATVLKIPQYIRLKDFSKLVRGNAKEIAKRVCVRAHKKYYMEYNYQRYKFDKLSKVILPYELVQDLVNDHNNNSRSKKNIEIQYHDVEPQLLDPNDYSNSDQIQRRTPIVSIMGHINHGKTSLMDSIVRLGRSSSNSNNDESPDHSVYSAGGNVAEKELEGITQTVNVCEAQISTLQNDDDNNTKVVTFLDTPGHYHFYRMRNSASNLADMAIIVVSLEEGCLLQTQEAIGIVEELQLPTIVCLNKMDIASHNVHKVQEDLQQYVALQNPNNVPMIPITAIDPTTLDPLLNAMNTMIESLNLDAVSYPNCPADGIVLEVNKIRGVGNIIRVLIRNGILNVGDEFVCGYHYCRVKALWDPMSGKKIEQQQSCYPGHVVDVQYKIISKHISMDYIADAPIEMGFHVMQSNKEGESIVNHRILKREFQEYLEISRTSSKQRNRDHDLGDDDDTTTTTTTTTTTQLEEEENAVVKVEVNDDDVNIEESKEVEKNEYHDDDNDNNYRLPIIIKADNAGSLACILDTLYYDDEYNTKVNIIYAGIGDVTPTNIHMASSQSDVDIYCFKVGINNTKDKRLAKMEHVTIKCYNTIHELIDDVMIKSDQ